MSGNKKSTISHRPPPVPTLRRNRRPLSARFHQKPLPLPVSRKEKSFNYVSSCLTKSPVSYSNRKRPPPPSSPSPHSRSNISKFPSLKKCKQPLPAITKNNSMLPQIPAYRMDQIKSCTTTTTITTTTLNTTSNITPNANEIKSFRNEIHAQKRAAAVALPMNININIKQKYMNSQHSIPRNKSLSVYSNTTDDIHNNPYTKSPSISVNWAEKYKPVIHLTETDIFAHTIEDNIIYDDTMSVCSDVSEYYEPITTPLTIKSIKYRYNSNNHRSNKNYPSTNKHMSNKSLLTKIDKITGRLSYINDDALGIDLDEDEDDDNDDEDDEDINEEDIIDYDPYYYKQNEHYSSSEPKPEEKIESENEEIDDVLEQSNADIHDYYEYEYENEEKEIQPPFISKQSNTEVYDDTMPILSTIMRRNSSSSELNDILLCYHQIIHSNSQSVITYDESQPSTNDSKEEYYIIDHHSHDLEMENRSLKEKIDRLILENQAINKEFNEYKSMMEQTKGNGNYWAIVEQNIKCNNIKFFYDKLIKGEICVTNKVKSQKKQRSSSLSIFVGKKKRRKKLLKKSISITIVKENEEYNDTSMNTIMNDNIINANELLLQCIKKCQISIIELLLIKCPSSTILQQLRDLIYTFSDANGMSYLMHIMYCKTPEWYLIACVLISHFLSSSSVIENNYNISLYMKYLKMSDDSNCTLFMHAVNSDNVECAKWVLKQFELCQSIDEYVDNGNGKNIDIQHQNVCELQLNMIDAKDKKGKTALNGYARSERMKQEIIQWKIKISDENK